jgi:uncharacterized protein YcbX
MHPVGTVDTLWRHPVKSMRGHPVGQLAFNGRGVVGDRLHAVRTADGGLGSGKTTRRFRRLEGLLQHAAWSQADEPPQVRLDDGREFTVGDLALDAALSQRHGQPLRLAREAEVPHLDAAPVHLVTTSSLAWLQDRWPGTTVDPRRFRPNLVVATAEPAWAEHGWIGRTLAIGAEVRLEVLERCERCVMVALEQDDLGPAPGLLRTLAEATEVHFGVYARVRSPGVVRVGDGVRLVPP